MRRIYLDNNASAPIDPRILSVLTQEINEGIGNASSVHYYGQKLKQRLIAAKHSIAEILDVRPTELYFTSGATESINMILRGLAAYKKKGHIITTDVEHASVYETIKDLESAGFRVTYLKTEGVGAPTPDQVEKAICNDTCMIVLMSANNETGVKTDIEAIANIADSLKINLIVDAVASLGKEPIKVFNGISSMCFSGHKIHAPKGIGLSYIRKNVKIKSLITGGHQEYNFRAGTENVAFAVALAKAFEILHGELEDSMLHMKSLRDNFEMRLSNELECISINGSKNRIVNTSNLMFNGIDGETLLTNLDLAGVCASHGSACASGALQPSRVLLNMGLSTEKAASSIRFSFSRMNTSDEVDSAVSIIVDSVKRR